MKPYFFPYVQGNPYQPKLAEALEKEGIKVQTDSSLKDVSRRVCSSGWLPDLVHLHWLPRFTRTRVPQWFLFGRRLSALCERKVPVIWTVHNLIPHDSKFPALDLWLSRKVARKADRIICHSEAAKEEIVESLSVRNREKVKVIPHGNYIGCYAENLSPSECRTRLGLSAEALVFLFLGQIRPYKGIPELITAFRLHSETQFRLVLAGRPVDESTTKFVQRMIAGDSRIIFRPGFVADADIQIYMQAADVVVFPYHKSLTSGALVLAMSFGRAAIAARHAGTIETLAQDGGILYDPAIPTGLSAALGTTMRSRTQLVRMGENNRKRALTWDWNSVARETVYLYREVTAKGFSTARRA